MDCGPMPRTVTPIKAVPVEIRQAIGQRMAQRVGERLGQADFQAVAGRGRRGFAGTPDQRAGPRPARRRGPVPASANPGWARGGGRSRPAAYPDRSAAGDSSTRCGRFPFRRKAGRIRGPRPSLGPRSMRAGSAWTGSAAPSRTAASGRSEDANVGTRSLMFQSISGACRRRKARIPAEATAPVDGRRGNAFYPR